jgi:hypothetical protein
MLIDKIRTFATLAASEHYPAMARRAQALTTASARIVADQRTFLWKVLQHAWVSWAAVLGFPSFGALHF